MYDSRMQLSFESMPNLAKCACRGNVTDGAEVTDVSDPSLF